MLNWEDLLLYKVKWGFGEGRLLMQHLASEQ
jgi:hypothetical protein